MQIRSFLLPLLVVLVPLTILAAPPDPIDALLALDAPPAGTSLNGEPLPSSAVAPPDNVAMEILLQYWATLPQRTSADMPSARLRDFLGRHVGDEPALLPGLTRVLAPRPEVFAAVKKVYDENAAKQGPAWAAEVQTWLRRNSGEFRPELLAAAKAAKDDQFSISGREDLEALARLDPVAAAPVLQAFSSSNSNPRTRALALALRHARAVSTQDGSTADVRGRLIVLAKDRQQPASARDIAVRALLAGDGGWTGSDELFRGLVTDPSLEPSSDGASVLEPLAAVVRSNQLRWLSMLTGMLTSSKKIEHDSAARILADVSISPPLAAAVMPLLPWLADRNWAAGNGMARLRLIEATGSTRVSEAIPGLLEVLRNDPVVTNQLASAESLIQLGNDKVTTPLRKVFVVVPAAERLRAADLLVRSGGLTAAELAEAVEAFVMFRAANGAAALAAGNVAGPVAIGAVLARDGSARDDAAKLIMERSSALKATAPETSAAIDEIVWRWQAPFVDQELALRIGAGDLEPAMLRAALLRRDSMRRQARGILAATGAGQGARAGVAAALAGLTSQELTILTGSDAEAQRALFAAARMMQEQLPAEPAAALLNAKDLRVAAAAHRFLESDETLAARTALEEKHHGEAWVHGARPIDSRTRALLPLFEEWESSLRAQMRSLKYDEIYALGQLEGDHIRATLVMSRGDDALLVTGGRTRTLTGEEFANVHNTLSGGRFDDSMPLISAPGGPLYEYLHFTKEGARRIFMMSPADLANAGSPYDLVIREFAEMK